MIVAELRILPIGTGSSMEKTLQRAVESLQVRGIKHHVGPLGTTIESESLTDILAAVRVAHEAALQEAPRVVTELTIDHRLDKPETAQTLAHVAGE